MLRISENLGPSLINLPTNVRCQDVLLPMLFQKININEAVNLLV